jgi:dipeptidyl aminopeptidase/acylaminoacyl peptidase
LAIAWDDGKIRLWDVAAATTVWTIQGHPKAASAVAFAPDGRRLASGAEEDPTARVWDTATGSQLASFSGHAKGVRDLAFAPDGETIASVGGDYRGPRAAEVFLWSSRTGRQTGALKGHTSLVTAVAYFPGGRRLATASDDRTIKLWNSATGENVFTLRGHTSGVVSLAISGDGRQVVSGSIDYSAKTWSTAVLDPSAAAELSLRRAAVERVQSLHARYMLTAEVLERIRADTSMSPGLRAAALEIAEHRTENASGLYQAGWLAVLRPGGKADDYRAAVRRLEAACKVVADDPQRRAQYARALALALYRAGQPARAIATIHDVGASKTAPAGTAPASPVVPLDLAVTAMASRQLGDSPRARAALEQLRTLVHSGPWTNDQEAQMFFHEAEDLVGGLP